ncbi:DNA adenine methylase [Dactylosporangium sp. NPDC005555]|uniref:DNA adenine methylase n=1 Tax=Dactylosporangium sp. NPDC005555 TaxID=3154889 RepID=UPI0033B3B871
MANRRIDRSSSNLARRRKPWAPDEVEVKPRPVTDPQIFSQSVISPLRYPGAKRQLVPIIEQIVKGNVPRPRLFVEPFCGGASTTLRLVGTGVIEHAVLADVDELVNSFWYVAAFDTNWLIDRMMEIEVTVAKWEWFRLYHPRNRRDKALKCLFLNRTTFSGILHGRAGPIGGKNQSESTKYKIDCRFNKGGLAARLRAVGELADSGRILDVWNTDWRTTLARLKAQYSKTLTASEILVYLDPPYIDKAEFLYPWAFGDDEHRSLASTLTAAHDYNWILSYDDNPLARELYPPAHEGRHVLHAKHRYSAASLKASPDGKRQRPQREELLITNFTDLPDSDAYHALGQSTCSACQIHASTTGSERAGPRS